MSWFTGEAIQEDEFGDIEDDDEDDDVEEDDDDEEEDDEEEDDDDDDEEEDEEESKPKKKVGILLMWPDFILFIIIIIIFVFKTDANHYLSYCFGMLRQSSAGHKVCYLFSCFLHFHYRLPLPPAPYIFVCPFFFPQ